MEKYVLIFKTTIKTVLDRSNLIKKLYSVSNDIKWATIDLDDEDFILRIESAKRNENFVKNFLQKEGYQAQFLAAFVQMENSPVLIHSLTGSSY